MATTAQGDIGVFGGSVVGEHMGASGVMADSGAGLTANSADSSALHSTTQVGTSGTTMPEGVKAGRLGASPATPAAAEPESDDKPRSSRSSTLLRRDCTTILN